MKSNPSKSLPASKPCLKVLPPAEDSPALLRLTLKARDARSGADFFFAADQVVSIEPTREGCCLRLRRGRWIMLQMSTAEAAALVWGAAA